MSCMHAQCSPNKANPITIHAALQCTCLYLGQINFNKASQRTRFWVLGMIIPTEDEDPLILLQTHRMVMLQVSNIHELGLVTCSLDSTIKITDLSRCKVLHTVTAHRRGVHCFAHSKAFSLCASGGLERDILLWQGSTNRQVGEMTGHAASISHLAIDNRRCQVWD